MTDKITTIVWDFDGVLNRNYVDGRFLWQDDFEVEFGQSIEVFEELIFSEHFQRVIRAELDLTELIAAWADEVAFVGDQRDIIDFWFQNDYYLDDRMMTMLARASASSLINVLGTNNEPLRTQFIAEELGFANRLDRIFSSGQLGVAKPDDEFFHTVAEELHVAPETILIIDDTRDNTDAALGCGWHAHWFDGSDYDGLEKRLKECGA